MRGAEGGGVETGWNAQARHVEEKNKAIADEKRKTGEGDDEDDERDVL